MAPQRPPELVALLDGRDSDAAGSAWSALLARYNRLLLKAAGAFGGDYDARMDRYRYVLEELQRDQFRRLRGYEERSRSTFAAWLVVVARRLCLDFERSRHGRTGRGTLSSARAEEERRARRELLTLVGSEPEPDHLPDTDSHPEARLREDELYEALRGALVGLEPRDRMLLKLRYEDGLSVRRVKDVMDFPSVFHVYRKLRQVLDEVRRRLRAGGVEDAEP